MLVEKMRPESHRQNYIQNLKGYIEMVENFLKSLKEENVQSILKTKAYNLKLMRRYSRTVRKYEGTSFKYFRNKIKMEKYNGSLEAVDRINDLMKPDTDKLLEKIRHRNS